MGSYPTFDEDPWHLVLKAYIDDLIQSVLDDIANLPGSGGDMRKDENLAGLLDVRQAQANLGLGDSAPLDVGTVANTVAAGDDPRIVGAMQSGNSGSDISFPDVFRANIDVFSTEEVIAGFQAIDDDLTALSGIGTTSFGRNFLTFTDATPALAALGITGGGGGGGSFDALGAAAAAQAASQPLNAALTLLAGLSTTSYGRNFLTFSDATPARSALSLGTASLANRAEFQAASAALTALGAVSTTPYGLNFLSFADATPALTALNLGTPLDFTALPIGDNQTATDTIVAIQDTLPVQMTLANLFANGITNVSSITSATQPSGGKYSIQDGGTNSLALVIYKVAADALPSLYVGSFLGNPFIGFGPGASTFPDANITYAVAEPNTLLVGPYIRSSGGAGTFGPARWVGGQTGAPSTGTYKKGDFVIDGTNGALIVCTVAGTPGTWVSTAQPAFNPSFSVTDGSPTDGKIAGSVNNLLGAGWTLFGAYSNSADLLPSTGIQVLAATPSWGLGPGGSSQFDFLVSYLGTAAASVTGTLNMTAPNMQHGVKYNNRKLWIKAQNHLALRHLRAKLASGTATVLYGPGDSITEGTSLTNTYDRWTNRVTDILSNAVSGASPGCVGYVPMATVNSAGITGGGGSPTSPVTNFWSIAGATGDLSANGLGQRGLLTAPGSTCSRTATVNCSSFDLFYNKKNTFGGITITIDGSPTTIDANGTGTLTMAKWNSGALTSGPHTIIIATTNTGVANATFLNDIAGVEFYLNNETTGIRQYDAGHPVYPSQGLQTRELQQVALIQPDVVFITWGANDAAFGVAPFGTATNYISIVSQINGVCTVPPSIIFVATWGNGSASVEPTWITYRDAIFNAAADSGAGFIDIYETLGWQGASTVIQDGIAHPNVAGSKAYAEIITKALDLPTGMSPSGGLRSGLMTTGGAWSVDDAGANSVLFSVFTHNYDPFASAILGTFVGNPIMGFGTGSALFDASISRSAAGVLQIGSAIKLSGLSGATANGRYVGTTSSGAPTGGGNSFSTGDWVTTRDGHMFTCTAGGSPGTWAETGTGKFAPLASPIITGHPTIEGITSTGATGIGNYVFDATPTLTNVTLNGPIGGTAAALFALLAGRSGGQTLSGGTGNSENLTLNSNSGTNAGTVAIVGGSITMTGTLNTLNGITSMINVAGTGGAGGAGNSLVISGTATSDDPTESTGTARVTTTNATVSTLCNWTVASFANDIAWQIEAKVLAHWTGGSAGATGDTGSYGRLATFKNIAGTVTQISTTTALWDHESQAGWDVTFDVSGNNIRCRITGALNNNITWHGIFRVITMGT